LGDDGLCRVAGFGCPFGRDWIRSFLFGTIRNIMYGAIPFL
jgi:hypothetical protein